MPELGSWPHDQSVKSLWIAYPNKAFHVRNAAPAVLPGERIKNHVERIRQQSSAGLELDRCILRLKSAESAIPGKR